jgi:hypothetical protein
MFTATSNWKCQLFWICDPLLWMTRNSNPQNTLSEKVYADTRIKYQVNNKTRSSERTNYLLPLIWHGLHRKRCFLITAGTSLPSCYLATIGGHRETQSHMRPTILLYLCVSVVQGMCLLIHFSEPLPNDRRDTHMDTDWREWFMKCAVKLGSGAMIYIPSIANIRSATQKRIRGGIHRHKYTQTAWKFHKRTLEKQAKKCTTTAFKCTWKGDIKLNLKNARA